MTESATTEPLWRPSPARIGAANITAFMAKLKAERGVDLTDYAGLYDYSLAEMAAFWETVWDFCGVLGDRGDGPTLVDGAMNGL